jgi:hypothetical protein
MSSQKKFLKKLVDTLDRAGIAYMVTGSLGSSFHGRPRATNDADIVIAPTEQQLWIFVRLLGKNYYLSTSAAQQALRDSSMFNVIDIRAGWKVDFIIRKNSAFGRQEFERRRKVEAMGLELWVVSPEDAILSKLEWAKTSGSEQQFRDALGVATTQCGRLDLDYLYKWAEPLGLLDRLEELLGQAKRLSDAGGQTDFEQQKS